jgi:amidohydrolase
VLPDDSRRFLLPENGLKEYEVNESMDLRTLRTQSAAIGPDVVAWRRRFHENPELPWKERETTRFIAERLRELGCENIRIGVGESGTGVIADLNANHSGPCVAIRGDIDALPLDEETDVPFRSKVKGVMHACGHDAHAAILLGVATVLSKVRGEIPGRIRLIFQPAEEAGFDSGAGRMIEGGALEGVDAIIGLHVWSSLPSGVFGLRSGGMMASADVFELTVKGKGGHGGRPQDALDPTIAAATIITTMQSIISREIDPLETAVLSIGKIESGTAPNIIPETARITGNVRSTSPSVRASMEGRMKRIADGICMATRCEATLVYTPIYPVTVNDPAMTALAQATLTEMFGAGRVVEPPVAMGSEDFSYYEEKVPGTFIFAGMADPAKGTDAQHHNPRFRVDEDIFPDCVAALCGIAWRRISFRRDRV